ncbi:HxlR family transcriptional regulator [Limnothrix sp. PR1529]|uniref:winged helix-turn-helix transcriptional regulator n=1 Tax=Limnothrix sp. PR1529 TaxID=1704291 RepID=UPI00081DC8C8|nr:helix-turn-helix domain-containing protein [Limnothrix sp. PR1529]OCQ96278.1 HxlR family transcriptional regulator [Limnothrix sp. P13C2]PIB14372.1 HxlR family transcriptional regulator [Limnothrix sp. PR1529]
MIRQFPEPDLFTLNCPTQQVLDIVAHKWVVIILYCLAYGPKRYGEIHRRIDGISQKVLTQSLKSLVVNGLVNRRVLSGTPANVEYSLSELGLSLIEPLMEIANWSRAHFSEILAARNQLANDTSESLQK